MTQKYSEPPWWPSQLSIQVKAALRCSRLVAGNGFAIALRAISRISDHRSYRPYGHRDRAGGVNNGSAQAGAFPEFPVDSPLGDDRFDGGTDYHRSLAANGGSQGNWWDNLQAEQGGSQALVPWPGTDYRYGDASMAHSGAFARPAFSATELDLPRLTNPALEGELPPEWEDLLADEFASQRAANGRNGHNGHSRNSSYEPDYGNSQLQPGGYPSNDYSASSSYNGWSERHEFQWLVQ